MAQLQIQTQDFNNAIRTLEGVLSLNPENTQALFWLGVVYFSHIRDASQAIGYLQRCTDYDPASIGCYYFLGRSLEYLERMEEAAEAFGTAIANGSKNPYHLWWAGRSQISIGNCTRAMTYLNEGYAIALNGTDSQIVADYQAILPLCQAGARQAATPTPSPTFEPFRPASGGGN